jgi:gluconate 2-dehydrogenase gamma chain
MADNEDEGSRGGTGFSRRELLKRLGWVGAATAFSPAQTPTPLPRDAFETLTPGEGAVLEAVVARLIPTDENGPGATEAHAARYIDRALSGALSSFLEAYRAGLAALDAYARKSKGAPFPTLSPTDQDAVLTALERNEAEGFAPDSAAFFDRLRTHTIQGTFCDPYYGGNANFAGWDLIGYPGVRIAVTADQQNLNAKLAPSHKSAYDFPQFPKERP